MTLGLGGTPECLRAPTPSLLFNSLWFTRLAVIKEVVVVVIVKMMLMMLKMMKMMTMMMFHLRWPSGSKEEPRPKSFDDLLDLQVIDIDIDDYDDCDIVDNGDDDCDNDDDNYNNDYKSWLGTLSFTF